MSFSRQWVIALVISWDYLECNILGTGLRWLWTDHYFSGLLRCSTRANIVSRPKHSFLQIIWIDIIPWNLHPKILPIFFSNYGWLHPARIHISFCEEMTHSCFVSVVREGWTWSFNLNSLVLSGRVFHRGKLVLIGILKILVNLLSFH